MSHPNTPPPSAMSCPRSGSPPEIATTPTMRRTTSSSGRKTLARHRSRTVTTAQVRLPTADTLAADQPRSEEHTSELQSLMRTSYAVFCLKQKKQHTTQLH